MKHILSLLVALLAFLFTGHALRARPVETSSPLPSIDAQVRGFAPAAVLDFLQKPSDLRVQYLPADLGNTGRYDYIVAAYIAPVAGGKLRVLRNIGGRLEIVGTADPSNRLEIDDQVQLKMVYVGTSSVPVIQVDSVSADGTNVVTSLFRWTGTRLMSMLPPDTSLANVSFTDPQGTGVPQLINPPSCLPSGECSGKLFEVYRLENGTYTLAATSTTNPGGRDTVTPQKITLQPDEFSATEILGMSTNTPSGGNVVLKFGGLDSFSDPAQIDLSEVNLETLYLGRSLKPASARIMGTKEGKAQGFEGSFVEVVLPRSGVLQYLAKAQPTKPPEPGDVVMLPVSARMKNGFVLSGFVEVKIVGSAAR